MKIRNVNILSFSFSVGTIRPDLDENGIISLLGENLNGTEDIVLLPETCTGHTINEPGDRFLSGIAELASRNNTYILAAVNRRIDENRHANSAFLFDRSGDIAFCYDKMFPYWSEYDRTDSSVVPGSRAVFADTDFGRVSTAICFDANFTDLWQDIADLNTDIVLFSSEYSSGRQLCAHAINHHYMIVTSTQKPDFAIYDIDGKEVTYNRHQQSKTLISRARVDLDRVICHHNFNRNKILRMLRENPGKMDLEHDYDREEWCVIRSTLPEVNVRELCGQYGIETLRDYKRRSQKNTDEVRGYPPVRPERL